MNKTTRNIISFLSLILMIIAADRILTYLLEPMSRTDFYLHDIREMKEKGVKPDLFIVGNSRSVYGFDPLIFEEDLGLDFAYNASVVGQQISSKYYIAESLIREFDPKIIVFDIEWQSLNEFGNTRTQAKLLGLDRLTGLTKIRYILDGFNFPELIYAVSKPYRFRDNLFKAGTVSENLRLKKWMRDSKYAENYYGTVKGYDEGSKCVSKPFAVNSRGTYDKTELSEKSKGYLDRIVRLCRERNISLFIVSPPVSTMEMLNVGNYQAANDYYLAYAEENGVYYHNLNMLKGRDEIFNDRQFYNSSHLCRSGAETSSHLYAEIIRDELAGIDTSGRFYASVDELTADIKRVVAAGADVKAKDGRLVISDLRYSAGKDMEVVFEVRLTSENGGFQQTLTVDPSESAVEIPYEGPAGKVRVKITAKDIRGGTEASADYTVKI